MDHTVQQKDLGPLHRLLLKASPKDETGRRSIAVLASAIDRNPRTLYHHCKQGRIPGRLAKEIVAVAKGRVTLEDFHRFL